MVKKIREKTYDIISKFYEINKNKNKEVANKEFILTKIMDEKLEVVQGIVKKCTINYKGNYILHTKEAKRIIIEKDKIIGEKIREIVIKGKMGLNGYIKFK